MPEAGPPKPKVDLPSQFRTLSSILCPTAASVHPCREPRQIVVGMGVFQKEAMPRLAIGICNEFCFQRPGRVETVVAR
jgi:hypothetical protein